ncbi:MAG: hypothetical protein JXA07_02190 [Spirochaetes bacterium]|nr:hypothetical protein [Spirochaetota bacterium]
MKRSAIALISIIIIAAGGCSRPNYEQSLIGAWAWTGDHCAEDGSCKKVIITDDDTREVFTADGMYLSERIRTGYRLKGPAIYLEPGESGPPIRHGDIISIKDGVMLLRMDNGIRRYEMAGDAK